jgi:capsular exopolysaccharide synthesis family protein
LRTSLLLSTAGGPARTILITSGQGGEGKTVTSLNLAKSLAQIGAKVLLIDADLRCPKLHTINDISNKAGLTNLLTTKKLNQELINETIQKDPRGGLHILTAGPQAPNPANLLSSEEMRNLLKTLSSEYSHILVDSPPVLYFADSPILSTYVDAVVLIARNNVTSQQTVLQAKKRLLDVHAKIIGIVLNDIPLNSRQYYDYDYYKDSAPDTVEEDHGMLGLN